MPCAWARAGPAWAVTTKRMQARAAPARCACTFMGRRRCGDELQVGCPRRPVCLPLLLQLLPGSYHHTGSTVGLRPQAYAGRTRGSVSDAVGAARRHGSRHALPRYLVWAPRTAPHQVPATARAAAPVGSASGRAGTQGPAAGLCEKQGCVSPLLLARGQI